MKKLLITCALFTSVVNAQNINFPDANLKDLILFSNPSSFSHNNQYIQAFNENGELTSIDLDQDGEIQINEALKVSNLVLSGDYLSPNELMNLTGLENFTNLKSISFDHFDLNSINNLLAIQLQSLSINFSRILSLNRFPTSLEYLTLQSNELSQINISDLVNLKTLSCYSNKITQLDISTLTNLNQLYCQDNLITQLNIANLPLLETIVCNTNKITILNLSNLSNLKSIDCSHNQLAQLDVSNISSLISLGCSNNNLESMDISQNKKLFQFYAVNNNLKSLNIKNGINFTPFIGNNPNLKYVCKDENQDSILYQLAFYNYTNVEVNSYCTFTPGGDFNTISGNVIYDFDNNGCDALDPKNVEFTKINFLEGTNTGGTFVDKNGNYSLLTPSGSFFITPIFENNSFFTVSPPNATILFPDNLNHTSYQDFCITPNGNHPDVEIIISPIQVARPGFEAKYQINYKNKGNQKLSGDLNLKFDDNLVDFISSSILPNNTNSGNLNWNYSDLLPFESVSIQLTFKVNSPSDSPTVNIGDKLEFTVNITPKNDDETPLDNTFILNQTVVGAYDPNIVTCLEGTEVSDEEIGNYLHYTVDFENTGNYPAENIIVKEILDETKYDIQSLQILNSSNPMNVKITGNKIEYIFENIQLQANQHGNLLMKTKTLSTLKKGDDASRSADIYFDYNLPVKTNDEKTTFNKLTAGLDLTSIDQSITVYPNPSNGVYTIKTENQTKQLEVFDASGRLLLMKIGADNTSKVDITNQEQGIYFLKITTDKGVKVMEVSKN